MSNSNIQDDFHPSSPGPFHAHFDCFSGAAGDMMLAACLDAAGTNTAQKDALLRHVSNCLEQGLPELKGEFSLSYQRAWRGQGSIAALHVTVESTYHHQAAPVPRAKSASDATEDNQQHEHQHEHQHSHSHQHQHTHDNEADVSSTTASLDESHNHSHSHSHTHTNASPDTKPTISDGSAPQSTNDTEGNGSADSHSHAHSHYHSHAHSHSHHHDHHNHNSNNSNSPHGPLRNLPQIRTMLHEASPTYIPPWVRDTAIAAFTELAQAEAYTHGADSVDDVHFHEVGAVDSIVDTVGTLLALHKLQATTFSCSRLPLGEGTVWTAHGLLPVPAPATLRLMVGMPTCPGPIGTTGELVTPTAAALLRVLCGYHHTANSKNSAGNRKIIEGRPPAFTIRHIGIGAGTKNFDKHPNILRLLLGNDATTSTITV